MDEGVSHDLPDDRAELAELRRRAYSADADIAADPAALARLDELENLVRAGSPSSRSEEVPMDAAAEVVDGGAVAGEPRRPRWHTLLVAGTASLALALGAVAATTAPPVRAPLAAMTATPAPTAADGERAPIEGGAPRSPASAADFAAYLDYLRGEVLSGPSAEFAAIKPRLDLERLVPKGTHHGRSVWAGPTADGETCLVVSREEGPFIECVATADLAERGISVILPPGTGDRVDGDRVDSDPVDGSKSAETPGEDALVRYTLLSTGAVVTELVAEP